MQIIRVLLRDDLFPSGLLYVQYLRGYTLLAPWHSENLFNLSKNKIITSFKGGLVTKN